MGGVTYGLARSPAKAGAQPQTNEARGSALEKKTLFTRRRGDAEKKTEGAVMIAPVSPAIGRGYEGRLRRRLAARSAITSSRLLLRVSAPPREPHYSFFARGQK